jgi:hypothetical protein
MSDFSQGMAIQNYTPKSFWKKPEGVPGMLLLAAGVVGGLYGMYLVLPFLILIVGNTIELAALLGVLGLMGYIVTNGTVRTLAKNIFQSICRGVASLYTTVDPIGILRNNLDDMKTEKGQLDQTIQRFAGSDNKLQDKITEKQGLIQKSLSLSQQCERTLATKRDPLERERLTLKQQTELQKAGLLDTGLKQLQMLKDETAKMLVTFRHWSQIADSKIQRTEFQVEFLADQRSTILDAKSTLSIGQRLLRGNPEQLKLVDAAIEYLAEDASRTIGEIREFSRYSDKLLTDIDIENGAQAESAKEHFAVFNQKLLSASNSQPVSILDSIVPDSNKTPVAVPVQEKSYDQLLEKIIEGK